MGLLPKDEEILPPSDDRVFKLVLTPEDAKPALMDLVSTVIEEPVLSVEVRNNEVAPEDTAEKAERFDVNCQIHDGTQVDLEMQASRIEEMADDQHNNLKGKSIYYLSDLHSSQPSKGLRRYDLLVRTFQVTFCSYQIFPDRKSFVNSFSLRHDEDNELLSDAIRIIYVELSKLKEIVAKPVSSMTDMEKWAVFFRYASDPRYREKVNDVIDSKEALQVAGEMLMSISKDERERAVFRSRRMYQTDLLSNLATAEDRGWIKGKLEVARTALQMNMPIDDIVKLTGLTRKEIERLIR